MASPPTPAAHLRSRGEHRIAADCYETVVGSPPLARRAHDQLLGVCDLLRLTSARAESTSAATSTSTTSAAHLRSRGEHPSTVFGRANVDGSPPLARRARASKPWSPSIRRLTSARAESTWLGSWLSVTSSAHLRSRGEHAGRTACRSPAAGSPPLARRAHPQHGTMQDPRRLTSARAEST
ncbi:hypothetical protein STAN_7112 [Streptomyces sp. CBMAI 2042]|nr:hypothetical protein STAN_7112 [Streptomyces sp. CBMAI 2042]